MKPYAQIVGEDGPYAAFLFDAEGRRTTWLMRDSYCEDPRCIGPEVDVWLIAQDDEKRRLHFHVDVSEAKARLDADLPVCDRAIVDEFFESDEALRVVKRHRQIVRAWGLAREDAAPVPRREGMYCFRDFDLNRDDFAMPFASDAKEWSVIDQHCVNPSCDCEEASLSFYEADDDREVQHDRFAVRVGLVAGVARDAFTDAPLTSEQRGVLSDFQKELGDWMAELRLRRRLIREIASRRIHDGQPVATSGVKVGRNEPCPCGSGRKFKKCCGAA